MRGRTAQQSKNGQQERATHKGQFGSFLVRVLHHLIHEVLQLL